MRWIGMLLLGGLIGWFARDLTFDKGGRTSRTDAPDRREAKLDDNRADDPNGDRGGSGGGNAKLDDVTNAIGKGGSGGNQAGGEGGEPGGEASEADKAAADKALLDSMRKAMHSQLPAWQATFAVNARKAGKEMAKAAGLSDAEAEKVGEAFAKEGERAAEAAIAVMFGEYDGDPVVAMEGFQWFFGTSGAMTDALAKDLAGFLGDEAVGTIREDMRVRGKKQIDAQVEMQMHMMKLPDLTDVQRAEIKETFSGRGLMEEQGRVWSEMMKNPRKLIEAKSNEDWEKVVLPSMKSSRDRMRRILTPTQFKAYQAYEKRMIAQQRMWIQPMLPKSSK